MHGIGSLSASVISPTRGVKRLSKDGLFEREPDKFNQLAAKLADTEAAHAKCEDEWLELEMLREELEG